MPEFEQAELLALAAPKLQDEKLKQAFDMLLALENSLSKGLSLIEFLPYLEEKDANDATVVILNCTKNLLEKQDKISLIKSLIKQLNWLERDIIQWYRYIINTCQSLVEMIKNSFEIEEQMLLEAEFFSLIYEHCSGKEGSLYSTEIEHLSKEVQAIGNLTERCRALIILLNQFPLETEDKAKISSLALSALNQLATTGTNVELKYRIKALGFLQYFYEEENRIFGKKIYKELSENRELETLEKLKLLNDFSLYYCYDYKDLNPPKERLNFCAKADMVSITRSLYKEANKSDKEYIDVIEFLAERIWFDACWACEAVKLIEKIRSPITKVDAIILVLSELNNLYRLQEKLRKDVLNTVSLVKDAQERIALTIKILEYLGKKTQQAVAATLIENIDLLDEVQKAEVLADLTVYLSSRVRKKAFQIASSIKNEFNRTWACIAFTPYLTKAKKQQVIQDALEVMDKLDDFISVAQKALIIKELIKYGLAV